MKNQRDELIDKCNKMALLLGIVRGSLGGIYDCPTTPIQTKQTILSLLEFLNPRIDELFYNTEPIKHPTELCTKEWQNRCTVCNKYHVGLEPCTWRPNCS
jgi:hypothetical protein